MHTHAIRATAPHRWVLAAVGLSIAGIAGCAKPDRQISTPAQTSLRIGFGLTSGQNPLAGIQQVTRFLALEALVAVGRDGRPQPWLAEAWSKSEDGLTLRFRLRRGVTFHDGQPVTAAVLRDILAEQLPAYLGIVYDDVHEIRATSEYELEFALRRPSAFVLEGLDMLVQRPGPVPVGTGPYRASSPNAQPVAMEANESYYGGRPTLGQIRIQPYDSPRSAWADLLRGEVDMVYEVGVDALDSLRLSTDVGVFVHQRAYADVVILNVRRATLRQAPIRRALNRAVNRSAIVADVLGDHGIVADGPVWPHHWSFEQDLPRFAYQPSEIAAQGKPIEIHCLFADGSMERLGVELQRQLQAVGVNLSLERVAVDEFYRRVQSGDFDAVLADAANGPSMIRPYWFWHSGAPFNWGHYSNAAVDTALDRVRYSVNDVEYKAGVAAFQRAIIDDPPAIFLAWSARARAVSTRFEVPVEAGRDILSTLRLWRPLPPARYESQN